MQLARETILRVALIGILLLALTPPEACAVQNLWAWVNKQQRYYASSDSVTSGASLLGNFVFSIGIYNPGPSVVKDTTIGFTSTRNPQSLIQDAGGRSYAVSSTDDGAYRYTWMMPDISPRSSEEVWLNTPIPCAFNSGFDSSREVTPTLIESDTATQEVRIEVKPTEKFRAILAGVSLQGSDYVKLELMKRSDKPLLQDRSSTYMYWWVNYPEPNKLYQFSARLKVTNLIFPSKVDFVPYMEVMAYESQKVNRWISSEWRGTMQPDPDLSVWDVTIRTPANSQSNVGVEVARTVGYLGSSTAQVKTSIAVQGLPLTQSSSLYVDENGLEYNLMVDGTPTRFTQVSALERSVTVWLSEAVEHEIKVPEAIEVDPGTRYYCEQNKVTLSASHTDIAYLQIRSLSHTFNYVRQFLLSFDSGVGGNQTVGWINAGSSVVIKTSEFVAGALGIRYRFVGWSGTISSVSSTVSFVMNGPVKVTAMWAPDYSVTVLGAGLAVSALILAFLRKRSRKARDETRVY